MCKQQEEQPFIYLSYHLPEIFWTQNIPKTEEKDEENITMQRRKLIYVLISNYIQSWDFLTHFWIIFSQREREGVRRVFIAQIVLTNHLKHFDAFD